MMRQQDRRSVLLIALAWPSATPVIRPRARGRCAGERSDRVARRFGAVSHRGQRSPLVRVTSDSAPRRADTRGDPVSSGTKRSASASTAWRSLSAERVTKVGANKVTVASSDRVDRLGLGASLGRVESLGLSMGRVRPPGLRRSRSATGPPSFGPSTDPRRLP